MWQRRGLTKRLCRETDRPTGRNPLPTPQDLWAIYTRTCLRQSLEMSRRAALNDDPDVEAANEEYGQPARAAPKQPKRR